jgi:large subunit ribosomal protein L25
MLKIKVELRAEKDLKTLREEGFIPAVFYGPKQEAISCYVKEIDFIKLYKEAGESSIVVLDDGSEKHESLIHDVQVDPINLKPTHIDFYVIEKGKKVEVDIPLVFVGVSPAEKTLGGALVKVMHEIKISAMPKDLPHEIEVDISSLVDFDSQIHAKDLVLPTGVELVEESDEVVALVQEAKEIVEEPIATPDLSSIEVEKKGKTDEEGIDSTE